MSIEQIYLSDGIEAEADLPVGNEATFSFWMLVAYLLSQSFTIPILAVGPSWAIWPRFSDLAFFGLVFAFLTGSRCSFAKSVPQKLIGKALLLLYAACFFSFLLNVGFLGKSLGIQDGIYNLFRLAQFFAIYWIVVHIPLDQKRIAILRLIIDFVFLFVCAGIILTFFSVVPLDVLTAHLPQDPGVSGNWAKYARLAPLSNVPKGLGTISYTHAYGSVQVLMLLCLRMQLSGRLGSFVNIVYMLLALVVIAITESRAGFAAALLFSGCMLIRNPRMLVGGAVLAGLLIVSFGMESLDSSIRHQKSIVSISKDDSLSGRPLIWKRHLKSLEEKPIRFIMGAGFGSARVVGHGSNGHMLYLHLISETGFIGLAVFLMLFSTVLKLLYKHEGKGLPLFWGTIALMVSALTQETFYPVPALGHFIGLYLVCLAIALRTRIGEARSS